MLVLEAFIARALLGGLYCCLLSLRALSPWLSNSHVNQLGPIIEGVMQ